ncbi:MAG: hypothetical protein ACOZE5_03470 [Verrucomicrobiota bacterium]
MSAFCQLPVAATAGFAWTNLLWVILGITGFLLLLAGIGRLLAATHPAEAACAAAPAPNDASAREPSPETVAIIAAAVHAALGESARITAVVPAGHVSVNVDTLMQQWSLEGRREIYSSHRVR